MSNSNSNKHTDNFYSTATNINSNTNNIHIGRNSYNNMSKTDTMPNYQKR